MPSPLNAVATSIGAGASHFLSETNVLATTHQREAEVLALELVQRPEIRTAMKFAAQRFRILAGHEVPDEALVDFDRSMEEWAFHYVLLAINSDANYPKVLANNYGPPHEWLGISVPGNRGPGTGDNVDNNYSVIAIDGHASFEIRGQRMSPPTGDFAICVVGNLSMSMNIDNLNLGDLEIGQDGSFLITISPEPANGRCNHLRTTPDSRYLFIRDVRIDWRQRPNAYSIHRKDAPSGPPMSKDAVTRLAARFITDDVPTNFWFMQRVRFVPKNTVSRPEAASLIGGQAWSKLAFGHLDLGPQEAFVLTIDADDAIYLSIQLNNYWLMTLDYWDRLTTLNNSQSTRNADGTFTYVFSARDPGVHNWIDTTGLQETLYIIRLQWQTSSRTDKLPGAHASTEGRLVTIDEVAGVLPAGAKRVDPVERAHQLTERRQNFDLRFST